MNSLLVATDYSLAANNASRYAGALARVLRAEVILLNVSEDAYGGVDRLTIEATHLEEQFGITVTACRKKGNVIPAILEATKEYKPEIVMLGIKRHTNELQHLLGNTLTQLIKRMPAPLLLIPQRTGFSPIKTIAFANENGTSLQVLDTLLELASAFSSKMFVVKVGDMTFTETVDRTVDLHQFELKFKYIEGSNVPEALNEFSIRNHVHLLAMIPHRYSRIQRLFVASTTREMIFTTSIPLLLLPDPAE